MGTKIGLLGPDGQPIYKEAKPRVKSCNFCGTSYKTGVILVVSSNGLSAICDGCLGASINYMKVEYGYVPDMANGCWKKIPDHPLNAKEKEKPKLALHKDCDNGFKGDDDGTTKNDQSKTD